MLPHTAQLDRLTSACTLGDAMTDSPSIAGLSLEGVQEVFEARHGRATRQVVSEEGDL